MKRGFFINSDDEGKKRRRARKDDDDDDSNQGDDVSNKTVKMTSCRIIQRGVGIDSIEAGGDSYCSPDCHGLS